MSSWYRIHGRSIARDHRIKMRGFSVLLEPGEVGLLPIEEAADGIHHDLISRHRTQTAGFFQRQDALHPSIALVTGRPQGTLAPKHAKALGPLASVVGGLDTMMRQNRPEYLSNCRDDYGERSCYGSC